MKIERINENQIRCLLTSEDLLAREIRLDELNYGSDKLRQLLQDMMQQAFDDCGFEVNNMPLMIEAIPLSMDAILLIITRVEDPEELDSRFARFSAEDAAPGTSRTSAPTITGIDDILSLVSRLKDAYQHVAKAVKDGAISTDTPGLPEALKLQEGIEDPDASAENAAFKLTRFYLFRELEVIIRAARVCDRDYHGPSSLFKNPDDGNYYLILAKGETPAGMFNRVCNVMSEYGLQADYTPGLEEFFREHMDVILSGNALDTLREL